MLKPGIGYVRIDEFIETTGDDFANALKKLDEGNLKGLVLDLRANPGGLLTEAVSVAGHMLPKGVEIVSHHGRASPEEIVPGYCRAIRAQLSDCGCREPQFAESASGIVSGALQDHDRAWILGDSTFGKGLGTRPFILWWRIPGLALTTAKCHTPSGRLIQRDYSERFVFRPAHRKNTEARNNADVKMTDSGRTVYGGGGISPDEKFDVPVGPCNIVPGTPPCWGPVETELYLHYMYQTYTRHFFTLHKEQLPVGWNVDAGQMDAFHKWLLDQEVTFKDDEFTKEYRHIRVRLQAEIFKTAFNVDESTKKYQHETDPEIIAAVAALPQALTLLNRATQKMAERAQSSLSMPRSPGIGHEAGEYCPPDLPARFGSSEFRPQCFRAKRLLIRCARRAA